MRQVFSLFLAFGIPFALSCKGVAKDLGVSGALFKIEEESLLDVIQKRLKSLEKTGALLKVQKEIQKKIIHKTLHPTPPQGLQKTSVYRKWLYDPAIVVSHDIKDHQGRIFYKQGTRLNPLETLSWREPYLFFDGGDEAQIKWALSQESAVWVLTGGSPFDLEKTYQRRVFFDQSGLIVKKFNIRSVPARVSQKDHYLLVEEVLTTEKKKG